MSIRILLVDDHTLVRHGLDHSIQQEMDMEVVGQAADGRSAIKEVEGLRPDVVVMDVSMSDLNGIEATRIIADQYPESKVLALSMHARKKFVHEMFKAGAKGYLLKDCEYEELAQAIRAVAQGKTYVSPMIADVVVERYLAPETEMETTVFSLLTPREREVLQQLAEGNTTKEIGKHLFISPKTVEVHRLNIMEKLHMDNVAQLTKYAIQEGLTSPDP